MCPECGYPVDAGPAFAYYRATDLASIQRSLRAVRWTTISLVVGFVSCLVAFLAAMMFTWSLKIFGNVFLAIALGGCIAAFLGVGASYSYALWQIINGASHDAELRRWSVLAGATAVLSFAAVGAGIILRSPAVSLERGIVYSAGFTALYWLHLPVLSKLYRTCAVRVDKSASDKWWAVLGWFALAVFINAIHLERSGWFISLLSLLIFLAMFVTYTSWFRVIERSLRNDLATGTSPSEKNDILKNTQESNRQERISKR